MQIYCILTQKNHIIHVMSEFALKNMDGILKRSYDRSNLTSRNKRL